MMRYCLLRVDPKRSSPDPSTFLPRSSRKGVSLCLSGVPHDGLSSMPAVSGPSYDVFLSFSGGEKFAAELCAVLCQLGFRVFKDEGLSKASFVSPGILEAIERSRVSVVIFSEDYASSARCLDELVKIMECWKAKNQAVVLVFYGVRPSDVWHTEGRFSEKLSRHENSVSQHRVGTWRLALNETAWIVGYECRESELVLVDDVVRDVSKKLYLKDRKKLVGIDSRVEEILSLQCMDPSGVHIIGIWDMAGIGKTTIARELFNRFLGQYEFCYFLEDFHQMFRRKGLDHLRDEFLSKIFEEERLAISGSDVKPSFMKDRFQNKKVLVVLDNVKNSREVEILVGGLDWFGPGSRIIITSQNRQVLVQLKAEEIYEVKNLDEKDSFQLFFENASERGWSMELLDYADGVPFYLKVLCSYLWGKKGLEQKTSFLRLKQHPPTEIQNVLRRSLDDLDDNENNIFLDLASFFRGQHKDHAIRFLDGCGFFAVVGISGLVDKSIIRILGNRVEMHDVFQDMGRFIVREENQDPGKRSRLWDSKDISHILTTNTGTEAIEGIFLDASNSTFDLVPTVFERMYNLRLLKIYCSGFRKRCTLYLSQGLECLPDELRLLHWENYPSKFLPRNFNPKNLVELNMPYSNLEKLWKGTKNLEKLKKIRLSHSHRLIKFPRLSKARNLEQVDLEGCTSLVKVSSSIRYLDKLVSLNLKDCSKLRCLPATVHLESLEVLNLSGCSELEKVQEISRNVKELYLAGTAIKEVPQSIESLSRLAILDLEKCLRLQHLPAGISSLKSLVVLKTSGLKTSGFSKLENFPNISDFYSSLDSSRIATKGLSPSSLHLADNENLPKSSDVNFYPSFKKESAIRELNSSFQFFSDRIIDSSRIATKGLSPSSLHLADNENLPKSSDVNFYPSFKKVSAIRELNSSFQFFSDLIIDQPASIRKHTIKIIVSDIKVLPFSISHSLASRLYSLVYLCLRNLSMLDIPEDIGCLCSLKTLDLSRNCFQILPESIKKLSKLQKLCLSSCKNLKLLPELPGSIECLDAHGCTSLETISFCLEQIPCRYILTNCLKLDPNMLKDFLAQTMSRVEQLFIQHQQGFVRPSSFSICLPATTFWKWMIYARSGSHAVFKLSPSQRKSLLGFAVSVVVEFGDHNNTSGFAIRCICSWKNKNGVSHRLVRIFPGCDPRETGSRIRQDHMFVCFDRTMLPDIDEDNNIDASGHLIRFNFYLVDQQNKTLRSCWVKWCGVYFVTFSNINTSAVATKRPTSSSDPVEHSYGKEMGPPCKRARI